MAGITTLIAAGLGAAGSIYAANQGSRAAEDARNASIDANVSATNAQADARDLATRTLTPYSVAGTQARNLYNAALGIAPAPSAQALEAAQVPDWDAYWNNDNGSGRSNASHAAGDRAFQQHLAAARAAGDSRPEGQIHYEWGGRRAGLRLPMTYDATQAPTNTDNAASLDDARAQFNAGFEASPYWEDAQYATGQGLNALISTNAARGMGGAVNSGKAQRAASDIVQGYRGSARNSYMNALAGVADTGFSADSGIASAGQVFANNVGSSLRAATDSANAARFAGANALTQGVNDAAGFLGWGAGQLNQPRSYFSATPTITAPALSAMRPSGSTNALAAVPALVAPRY